MALTKYNYNSFDLTTAASKGLAFNSSANGFETAAEGSMTLIKTLTASSSSTLSFVNGSSDVVLDSTYPIYLFKFIGVHASAANDYLEVGFRDGDTNYDAVKTSTFFRTSHRENDTETVFGYAGGGDLAQSTDFQHMTGGIGSDNDQSGVGEMYLFNPSSTTFVKHFIITSQAYTPGATGSTENSYSAGYCNTTTAIDGVQFKMTSGNIDAGTFKLYGIKDS